MASSLEDRLQVNGVGMSFRGSHRNGQILMQTLQNVPDLNDNKNRGRPEFFLFLKWLEACHQKS